MPHHLTPHLLTGSAVLGAALLLAALVTTTVMFCWSFHGLVRRFLVTANVISLIAGLLLWQHNYHHLQAAVLIGVVLIVAGTVALVMLTSSDWPIMAAAEDTMQYARKRTHVVLYALLTFVGLIGGTSLLAVTEFTWHWT